MGIGRGDAGHSPETVILAGRLAGLEEADPARLRPDDAPCVCTWVVRGDGERLYRAKGTSNQGHDEISRGAQVISVIDFRFPCPPPPSLH